ncbi:hypothetical protein JW960_08700 [candidate division KSB1 bacterium]|nr:hypothetical protein [candidate division KSB1 bacterium]
MPITRTLTDLAHDSDEIVKICKQQNEPVFLSESGKDEIVIMSRDYYERIRNLLVRFEKMYSEKFDHPSFHVNDQSALYKKLDEADSSIAKGNFKAHDDVIENLRALINER